MVSLVFSISNFFINKIYQANRLSVKKRHTFLRKPDFILPTECSRTLMVIRSGLCFTKKVIRNKETS